MASGDCWITDNLRDIEGWRAENLPLTVGSNETAKLFDTILRQSATYNQPDRELNDLGQRKRAMMETEPDFVMGLVLDFGMQNLSTAKSPYLDASLHNQLDAVVELAKAKKCTAREIKHAEAVNAAGHGYTRRACSLWGEILHEHPNDLLALKMLYDTNFFIGDYEGCRDVPGRALRLWEPPQPQLKSYLHGIYSYGLEECGDFEESRRQAQLGLGYNPKDGWCVHAIAHCYEMESDFEGGLRFMEKTKPNWANCAALAPHNLWHTALFNVEKGDYEAALSLYDDEMIARRSGIILDITDSSSLLQRLQMEGVTVGAERWRDLLAMAKGHLDDHILLFNDVHFSLVLSNSWKAVADGEDCVEGERAINDLCKSHLRSLDQYAFTTGKGDNADVTRRIGIALCQAIVDYNSGNYSSAFTKLYPVRTELVGLGGSWAQRDVFMQLLIHSGLNSGDQGMVAQAMGVIQERETLKPNSPVAKRLLAKHKTSTDSGVGLESGFEDDEYIVVGGDQRIR